MLFFVSTFVATEVRAGSDFPHLHILSRGGCCTALGVAHHSQWAWRQRELSTCGRSRARVRGVVVDWTAVTSQRLCLLCSLATLRIAGFTWLTSTRFCTPFPRYFRDQSGRRGGFSRLVAASFGVANQGKWCSPSARLPFWCCLSQWPCGY